MKHFYFPLLLLALIFSNNASAESKAEIEAGKLLDSMQMQKTTDAAIPIVLDAMLERNPKIVPFKGVMLDFLTKHLSYEALKPAYVEIYAAEFSADELTEMTVFYSSKTGIKYVDKLPTILTKASQLGEKSVQDNMPELEKMLKDEIVRIQLEEASK